MSWLYLVIIAQFFNALVALADKYLVTSPRLGQPVIYAFYMGIMSGAAVLLWPLGVVRSPEIPVIALSLVVGISYIFFLFFAYKALKLSEVSDVIPVLGAMGAMATLGFSHLFLNQSLTGNFLGGFMLLVAGTFITSYFHLTKKATFWIILAGILFGFSTVFLKKLFIQTSFWNGFFWSRLAIAAGAMLFLLKPSNLSLIRQNLKTASRSVKTAVVANKILAGLASLLILLAVKLGEVSLVNALTGLQFAFLLFLTILLTKKFPRFFYETQHYHALTRKIAATIIIIIGLVVLFRR